MAPVPLVWPPSLASYKVDLKLDDADDRYDDALQTSLDAAIAYVERVREDVDFLLAGEPPAVADPTKTATVTMDLILGTLRYAKRLDMRRETPVGVFIAGQVGSVGLAQWDADTERLLRVGKLARLRFA